VEEINSGTVLLLRNIQQVNLAKEYGSLSQGKPFPQKSKLVSLRPILGSDGLLRVGGRLLLPKDHPVTKAIIVYYHEKYLHGGSQALLAALRQRYWPIVASVINKCVRCFRMERVTCEHVMASLPANRVQTIVGHSIIRQRPEIRHPTSAISPSLSAFPRRLLIWKWSRISRRILSSQR